MRTGRMVSVAGIVLLGMSVASTCVAQAPAATPAAGGTSAVLSEAYPGLASNSLIYAKLSDLPAGVLLKAQGLTVTDRDIAGEIAKTPQPMQDQLKKNAFFVMENLATRQLLLTLAQAKAAEPNAVPSSDEKEIIQKYLMGIVASVQVSEAEVTKFYEENKEACGGATLGQVKDQLKQIVLQQKQQAMVDEHVRTLGRRTPIEVSASWAKEQSVLAKDNPVDKARASGKPSLVDFGSTGCVPCDMLAPILETLKTKYAGKVNVLFVHVGQEQILASRYGIQSIPMQFFYDKNGKEVFRHIGFWPQAEIEKKLAEMGAK